MKIFKIIDRMMGHVLSFKADDPDDARHKMIHWAFKQGYPSSRYFLEETTDTDKLMEID